MFEKDLEDLVKGIRVHKDDEAEFINKCLAEIKDELKARAHPTPPSACAPSTPYFTSRCLRYAVH